MNRDIYEGKWKQFRGNIKVWWGITTNNDLDYAAGKLDIFAGLLQERYGYTRQLTIEEINKRLAKYNASPKKKTGLTFSK